MGGSAPEREDEDEVTPRGGAALDEFNVGTSLRRPWPGAAPAGQHARGVTDRDTSNAPQADRRRTRTGAQRTIHGIDHTGRGEGAVWQSGSLAVWLPGRLAVWSTTAACRQRGRARWRTRTAWTPLAMDRFDDMKRGAGRLD